MTTKQQSRTTALAEDLYRDRHPFMAGPTEAVDYLIDRGTDAIEISWQLLIPIWVIRERFAHRAAQHGARGRDLQTSVK